MDRYGFSRTYRDFDELSADAEAWDVDLVPTEHGRFEGRVALCGRGPIQLGEARFRRSLIQHGAPPRNHWTFVFPAAGSEPFRWRGHLVGDGDVLIFPLNGELHSASTPGFHIHTVAIEANYLERIARARGLPDPTELIGTTEVLRCRPASLETLRVAVSGLTTALCAPGEAPTAAGDLLRLDDLPHRLLDLVVDTTGSERATARERLAIANQLGAFLTAEEGWNTRSVRALGSALGVSERTLRRACQEAYGCGPKALLHGHRLNAVRRALRQLDPATTRIAEVAGRHGFWHMGQLAADYRQRFGELPSQTLRRS